MKKLFITIGSLLVMSFCSMAQLQDRDTASMNTNDPGAAQEKREEMQEDAKDAGNEIRQGADSTGKELEQEAERTGDEIEKDAEKASVEIQQGVERTGDEVQQGAQSTDQELEKDAEEMEKMLETASIDKEGPNGEKLFMERGKYFYYNEGGKKVKVKKSEVRDKSVEKKNEAIKNNN